MSSFRNQNGAAMAPRDVQGGPWSYDDFSVDDWMSPLMAMALGAAAGALTATACLIYERVMLPGTIVFYGKDT